MSDRPQGEPEQAKMWSAFLKDDPNGLTVLLSFVRLRAVFESGELFNPDGATLRNREEGMNAFFESAGHPIRCQIVNSSCSDSSHSLWDY